jgi:uncharacterized protein
MGDEAAATDSDAVWVGPRPAIDLDAAPYWDGLRAHRIVVQQCGSCGRLRWPLRGWCGRCQSWDTELVELSGQGTVRSWIVVHRAHLAPFRERVPYLVVLVELDEQRDIVMPGAILGSAVPNGGDAVHARFEDVDDDLTLLRWEVVGSGGT